MSKRVKIGREGMETSDGRYIDVGTLEPRAEKIPALMLSDGQGVGNEGGFLIGYVTDIERDTDGWLWGVVALAEDDDDSRLVGKAAQMDLDHTSFENEESRLRITKGRITAVYFGDRPCWEGMVID